MRRAQKAGAQAKGYQSELEVAVHLKIATSSFLVIRCSGLTHSEWGYSVYDANAVCRLPRLETWDG